VGSCPNSTAIHPNRDIVFILTFGIPIESISTLRLNHPCHSDHLGIVFDIDISRFFLSSYSDVCSPSPRLLTSGNLRSAEKYTSYVSEQVKAPKMGEMIDALLDKAIQTQSDFSLPDAVQLNNIDSQLTQIMLAGERQCCNRRIQRQFRSPQQSEIAGNFSYWKQKSIMESKKSFNWDHLSRLRMYTNIPEEDHISRDSVLIGKRKKRG